MYDAIQSNKRKTYLLLFLFIVLIVIVGAVIGLFYGNFYFGAILAMIFALIYILIMYFNGDKAILAVSHAKEVKKNEYPHLFHTVEGLAIAAGIPKPKLYMIDDSAMNAFATGRNPENASITVTKGLVEKMNRQELEGVIAHEMSHIQNYDIKIMLVTIVMVGVVVLLSDLFLRSMIYGGGRNNSKNSGGGIIIIIGLVLAILAPLFAYLLKMAISRRREYLADASGAMLTRYPPGLANALKKIRDDKEPLVEAANKATASLFIANPLRNFKKKSRSFFSTHPSIDDRIHRLEAM
jgi:heat shock protein HtpX